MQIDVGKFYFIKDEFFEIASDTELMKNIVFPDIDNILKKFITRRKKIYGKERITYKKRI